MADRDFLSLPYAQRRLIVIMDGAQTALAPVKAKDRKLLREVIDLASIASPAFALTLMLTQKLISAQNTMHESGEQLIPVSAAEAADYLHFPVRHPRKDVVYISHPIDSRTYIPAADFHRFLFEHKMAEAQRLVISLGAITVSIIHVEGWDRSAGITIGASGPVGPASLPLDIGAKASREVKNENTTLATMKLSPVGAPRLPDELAWFDHEPLWQAVAHGRLESNLDSFVIDVRSTDDYGVNASLKTLIAKSGLDLGGNFIEHRHTIWRLEGMFSTS